MGLGWGNNDTMNKKIFKDSVELGHGQVFINNQLCLQNFPGDCGSLILRYTSKATEKDLKIAEKFASYNGYDKIFATLVGEVEYDYINRALAAFKKCRWKTVYVGPSNRNPYKTAHVLVKIIRNPKYKGY